MKCPKCNAEASGSGRFCRSCGAPLAAADEAPQEGSVCPSCGTAVRPGAKFCPACAAPLGRAPSSPPVVEAISICVNCGAQAKAGIKFCQSCGKAIAPSAAAATPDMMPTAVISTPVRPAPVPPPRPPQPPAMAEPVRPVAAAQPVPARPAVPPPRMEPPAGPRPVPKSEPARPATVAAQQPSGSNRPLVITIVVVLALVAVGLTYWFVLRKPAVQTASVVVEPPVVQPTAPAPAEASPDTASPESQVPPTGDAQQPAEATPAGATPAGNTETAGNATAAAARVPKRTPAKATGPAYAQAHSNAEQALAAAQYLSPPNSSALFWARKAKALGDPGAAQIEQQVFAQQVSQIAALRQSHDYDQARAQLYQLASNFPDRPEPRQMQDEIQQEQQRYTQQMEAQRRQAESQTQIKKFAVQHRHGTGNSFCTGIISVTPDGVGHYDCSTADSGGRCEHVSFAPGSLKEVKVRGDGSLHVASRQSGNFDFIGSDGAIKDAATALGTLVKR